MNQTIQHFRTLSIASMLAISLAACKPSANANHERPPMNVSTLNTEISTAYLSTTSSGRIHAIKNAEIRARVTGIVQTITFKQGSHVKAGDLLFKIDPAIYETKLKSAQAALSQAKANASAASLLAQRYRTLIKNNAISRQEYDNANAQAQQGKAAILAAEAAVSAAQIDLSYTNVTSPIDGIIGEALVTEGALVSAANASLLAQVQQLDTVYADFTLSSAELARVRNLTQQGGLEKVNSDAAKVTLLLADNSVYPHQGDLVFKGLFVDPATGNINLRATFANPDTLLLPGMYVQVQLPQGVNKKAISIPTQALQRKSDGSSFVYVVEDKKVTPKPVIIGEESQEKTIVLSGLKEGEQLIVEGFSKIGPGMPVNALPWAKQASATTSDSKPKPE